MDRINLSAGWRAIARKKLTFSLKVLRISWYSFDRPRIGNTSNMLRKWGYEWYLVLFFKVTSIFTTFLQLISFLLALLHYKYCYFLCKKLFKMHEIRWVGNTWTNQNCSHKTIFLNHVFNSESKTHAQIKS